MGEKTAYRKPALQALGDIRKLTAGHDLKDWGDSDYYIFKSDGGTPPPGNLSGE